MMLHEYRMFAQYKSRRDWRAGIMASSFLGIFGLLMTVVSFAGRVDEIWMRLFGLGCLAWGIYWPWGFLFLSRRSARQVALAYADQLKEATAEIAPNSVSLSSEDFSYDLKPELVAAVVNWAGGLIFLNVDRSEELFFLPERVLNDGVRDKILRIVKQAGIAIE